MNHQVHNHTKSEDHADHNHESHHNHHNHHHHGDFKQIFMNSLWVGIPILLLAPFMGLT